MSNIEELPAHGHFVRELTPNEIIDLILWSICHTMCCVDLVRCLP